MPHKYILDICLNNIIDYNIIIADMHHEYDISLAIINVLDFEHHDFYLNKIHDLLLYLDNCYELLDLFDELRFEGDTDDYKLMILKLTQYDFAALINS